jgi:hypothetical protein
VTDVDYLGLLFNAMPRNKLSKRATLVYECESPCCAMLYVFRIDGLLIAHQPRYKLSPTVNERESVQAARDRRTFDGNNHWKSETFPVSEAARVYHVQCDHCRAQVRVASIVDDARAATRQPTTIKVRNNEVR